MPRVDSLVLYKGRPARVRLATDKLEIEVVGGEVARVRPKDVELLHPGPLRSLADLRAPQDDDVTAAWEILAGTCTTLPELAELAYGAYTPATAWAAWQLVSEALYFRGTPGAITVATAEQVAEKQAARAAEAAERQAWQTFLERLRTRATIPEDATYLREVEAVALGQSLTSRVLKALGKPETAEDAHAFLLDLGFWDETVNPYPVRLRLPQISPQIALPELPVEPRRDLTHLPAFAIDDEGNDTPDDALSLDAKRLWVHVADAAALVPPGSAPDLEARARGSTSHLPERRVTMLPEEATPRLGLGLAEVSPALSIGVDMDGAHLINVEVVPSWIRVTRLSYGEAETRLGEMPFAELMELALAYHERRRQNGAMDFDFPEVKIQVDQGDVLIKRLPSLRSRALVQEAMILAGEAVAQYALTRGIPLPYATQEAPEMPPQAVTLAEMFAVRRTLHRRQYRSVPALHAGLGLPAYTQVTSPLRRYLDLVVHQQLRAHLRSEPLLDDQAIVERVGATEAVIGSVRQAESLSNRHWTLVYLLRHPGWQGEGVLVEKRGLSGTVIVPELALETRLHLPADLPLDSRIQLTLRGVDLPRLDVRWRVG